MATADWLVCAHCAGRVSEGRCPVCRAERSRLRERNTAWSAVTTPAGLAALALALAALLALLVARPA